MIAISYITEENCVLTSMFDSLFKILVKISSFPRNFITQEFSMGTSEAIICYPMISRLYIIHFHWKGFVHHQRMTKPRWDYCTYCWTVMIPISRTRNLHSHSDVDGRYAVEILGNSRYGRNSNFSMVWTIPIGGIAFISKRSFTLWFSAQVILASSSESLP